MKNVFFFSLNGKRLRQRLGRSVRGEGVALGHTRAKDGDKLIAIVQSWREIKGTDMWPRGFQVWRVGLNI